MGLFWWIYTNFNSETKEMILKSIRKCGAYQTKKSTLKLKKKKQQQQIYQPMIETFANYMKFKRALSYRWLFELC